MQRGKIWKRHKSSELLNINMREYLNEVEKELRFYDMDISCEEERQIKELIDSSLEVETEKLGHEKELSRDIVIRQGILGTYYSVKNIQVKLVDILEGLLGVIGGNPLDRTAAMVILLYKLFGQMKIDLDEMEVALCVILWDAGRHIQITDENVIEIVNKGLKDMHYIKMEEGRTFQVLNEMIRKGIVTVEAGKYRIATKVRFE